MALFTEELVQATIARVNGWHQEVAAVLGQPSMSPGIPSVVESSPLQQQLRLLLRVANGEISRGSAPQETVQEVETAVAHVLKILLGNPLHTQAPFPANFWQSDLGVLVSRVHWWLWADDLITISNAAALAFGENSQANRMRIVRAIDSGLLDWVPDPSVANPQQNRRVLRPQVERLGEQRRLPE